MTIDRRKFLQLAALGGGAVFASTLAGAATYASGPDDDDFYFVQLSDTHWGFDGPKINPDARGTLPKAIEAVNALPQQPDFVIFTGDHAQMNGYWLREYFPEAIAAAIKQMPSAPAVVHHLKLAGFAAVETEPWEVPRDIQDWFLYAGKYRPEIYLDPAVRAGISFFAQGICTPEETATGCQKLKGDIESGRFESVAERYRHNLGDYLFVVATK